MFILKSMAGLIGGALFIVGIFTAVGLIGIPLLMAANPLIDFSQS